MEEKGRVTASMADWIKERYHVVSVGHRGPPRNVAATMNAAKAIFIGDQHNFVPHQRWRKELIVKLYKDGDQILFEGGKRTARGSGQIYPPEIRKAIGSFESKEQFGRLGSLIFNFRLSLSKYFEFETFAEALDEIWADGGSFDEEGGYALRNFFKNLETFSADHGLDQPGSEKGYQTLLEKFCDVRRLSQRCGEKKAILAVALEALIYDTKKTALAFRDEYHLTLLTRNTHLGEVVVDRVARVGPGRVFVGVGSGHLAPVQGRNGRLDLHTKQAVNILDTALDNGKFSSILLIPRAHATQEKREFTPITEESSGKVQSPTFPLPEDSRKWLADALNYGMISEVTDVVLPKLSGCYYAWLEDLKRSPETNQTAV